MQTMFEIPMVTATGAQEMFGQWPTKAGEKDMCWELPNMSLCETHLAFHQHKSAVMWGWGNGRSLSLAGPYD